MSVWGCANFDVILVWAFDRIDRSTPAPEMLDKFNHLNTQFSSFPENIDNRGRRHRALIIIGAIAELGRYGGL